MSKPLTAIAALLIGGAVAWFASNRQVVNDLMAGENLHQEIYRLRQEIGGVRYALIVVNGLLAAILAALIF